MADPTIRIKCQLLWALCRKHSWASPLSATSLLNLARDRPQQGRGRRLVREIQRESYVVFQRGVGYRIKNDPDC